MPNHKNQVKSSKKKKSRGSGSRRPINQVSSASLTSNVLPRCLRRTLRYAETISFTTGTAGVVGATNVFLLNSIYDPNSTGVGHQPYGHDQLATWYSKYLVLGARVKLVCTTPGGSAELSVVWKVESNAFASIAGMSIDRCTETPMIGTAFVGPSGNDRSLILNMNLTPWKILGITHQQYRDQYTTYGAAMSANPSSSPTLEIGLASMSGAAGTALTVQVIIDFTCEFSEPLQLAQS